MATLSEETTDVVGRSSTYAVGAADADRGLVFDDLLLHRPHQAGVRTVAVVAVALLLSLGMWATGAFAIGGFAGDCFLISGAEYGGVTVVPGCGGASAASVQAVALQSESSTVTAVTPSAAVVSPRLWVPMPRLVVDLVGGLLG